VSADGGGIGVPIHGRGGVAALAWWGGGCKCNPRG
jgi:hypothetical protein